MHPQQQLNSLKNANVMGCLCARVGPILRLFFLRAMEKIELEAGECVHERERAKL